MSKNPKGPPITFFGTVTLFKNLNFEIFSTFFNCLQRVPLQFFDILQATGVLQSPKGPPFTILSLRYSADFGRSRLVNRYTRKSLYTHRYILIVIYSSL